MPYGCNVNIKGVGNSNSPENNDVTVINLFNTNQLINCTLEGEIPSVQK
jgi:hypothetical protein